MGGIGGAKFGASVVKATTGLLPTHWALLGVVSGGAGALAIGLGGTMVRSVRKYTERDEGGSEDLRVKIPRA